MTSRTILAFAICVFLQNALLAQENELEFTKWSGEINVPDPVAISFDNQGRAFVTQTRRRKSQDLDIRANRDWIPNDLSFRSVADKRNFYLSVLDPQKVDSKARNKRVPDLNKDNSHDVRDLRSLSEIIHVLQDNDQNGTADSINIFAENFQTEVTGIAAGVFAHQGSIYATIAPDVWRLTDTNNDGKADKRAAIAHGFGLHIAYAGHDMHGLTVGLDGRIYWTVGDKGISVTTKDGRKFLYPNQGGVMRCEVDGSNFEVFAHGLRNVQEVAFDQFGNLFGVDNDADQPGEKERFVYIVQDSDAGWRCNYQYRGGDYNPWTKEKLWETYFADQAAYIIPPLSHSIDGPAGFAFNPGTALSPKLKDYFFLTGAPGGTQIAFKAEPNDDAFKMTNQFRVGKGVPLVGINFGPDGGLYGVDWGGGYPLNQKGAVWKIDSKSSKGKEARKEVQNLLAKGFADSNKDELLDFLNHADQRIRLGAQFELCNRKETYAFRSIAIDDQNSQLSRIHAIYGLAQIYRIAHGLKENPNATESIEFKTLKEILDQPIVDPQIHIAALRNMRTFGKVDFNATPFLLHKNPHVRFHGLMLCASNKMESQFKEVKFLTRTLRKNQTYLRHAASLAFANIATPKQLAELNIDANETTRICAVLALRHLKSPLVAEFLYDKSAWVKTEAARAIYDDFSIPDALSTLAETKVRSGDPEAFIQRVMGANFRMGQPKNALRILAIAKTLANPKIKSAVNSKLQREVLGQKVEQAIECFALIENWRGKTHPHLAVHTLDPVTGRFRSFADKNRSLYDDATKARFASAFTPFFDQKNLTSYDASSGNGSIEPSLSGGRSSARITAAAFNAVRTAKIDVPEEGLEKLILTGYHDQDLRLASFNLLKAQKSDKLDDIIKKIMDLQYGNFNVRLDSGKIKNVFPARLRSEAMKELIKNDTKESETQIRKLLFAEPPKIASKAIAKAVEASRIIEKQNIIGLLPKLKTEETAKVLTKLIEDLPNSKTSESKFITLDLFEAANEFSKYESVSTAINDATKALSKDDRLTRFKLGFGGNIASGKKLFETHIGAQCARCHKIGKKGSDVGPALDGIATKRDLSYLIRAIKQPSADIDEKYQVQLIYLFNGQVKQGVLVKKTKKETTIADNAGKKIKIKNDDIEEIETIKESIMPDMSKTITDRQVRDILAYLQSLR